jgi:hypothetical protein
MDRAHHLVGVGRQDGEGLDRLAVRRRPGFPQAGQSEWPAVLEPDQVRLLRLAPGRRLPLVKAVYWHQAAALLERGPKGRLVGSGL